MTILTTIILSIRLGLEIRSIFSVYNRKSKVLGSRGTRRRSEFSSNRGWRYQKNRKNLFAIRVENQILAQKLEGEKRAQLILDHLDLRG